jgi:lysophospholipase L1-like esterase
MAIINVPPESRKTPSKLSRFLRTNGFTGSVNDVTHKWLQSEGYEGQLNSMWDNFLDAEGLVGSFTDKLSQWKRASFIRRYFNTLDPIQTSHYTIANPITFAGEYSFESDFVFGGADNIYPYGNDASFNSRLKILANGAIEWRPTVDGSLISAPAGTVTLIGLNHIYIERDTPTTGKILLNGIPVSTGATSSANCVVNVLGRTSSLYSDGIIANVKFTDLTNATTTTFALDTPEGDIEYSEENVFGGELVTNGDFSSGTTGWTSRAGCTLSIVNGALRATATGSIFRAALIGGFSTEIGKTYIFTFDVKDINSASPIRYYIGSTYGGAQIRESSSLGVSDSQTVIFTAISTTTYLEYGNAGGGSVGDYIDVDNISVREISNAVQYIGIPDINEATPAREEFTLVDGDWLGSELSEVSLYNVTAGLSQIIDNTTLRILTDSGGAFTAVTAFGFSDANSYILTFTATNSGGALNITDGNGVVTYFSSTASGDFEVVIPPNGLRFKRGFGGVLNDILVTNISIKRILEVAEQPVQTATLEINDSVIFVGDSMTYAGNGAPHAYWQWLQQAQNGALYVPIDGNQGISGETTAEIAARVQSYPSTPSAVIILMGENDANGVSLASMQANFESIFTKFSTSKIVYVMPQAFTQSISGSPFKQGRRDDLNLWLSTISNTYPNVNYISNAWDGITIYDGGVGADSYDGVHMNPSGAAKLGGNVATHISSDLASGTAYDAPLYDGNNLITTTSLSGVGGSKSNSSGDVADGWALTNGSGATVVASKGTQDGSSQIIEITGTASSGSAIRLRDSIGALNIPIGDVVEGFANIKITATDGSSAPVGIEGFGYELAYNKVTWLSQYYSGAQGSFDLSGATSGVIRAYPKEIDANISTLTVDFALQPTVGAVDIRIEVSKPTAYFGLT